MLTEMKEEERLITNRRIRTRRRSERLDDESTANTGNEHCVPERRKVERRRQIDPTTCERDYSGDEVEFMKAMDEYKRKSGRQFPTWSEVLEVIRCIGYRKVAEPTEIMKAAK